MSIFTFDESYKIGRVREVDTRKVSIQVDRDEDLRKAHVGHLVALRQVGAMEKWQIALIEKVMKSVACEDPLNIQGDPNVESNSGAETVVNTVRLTLIGTVKWDAFIGKATFSRSLEQVPEIDAFCFVLRDKQLEKFMKLLSTESVRETSLMIGKFTMDVTADAYLDGNKLFQRHAALLGSTGSGKSWTVATILEQTAKLPSANLIVFDLHGEYRKLSYASHLRIPGPEDLGKMSTDLLYLPYWLLNAEEMQSMFVDRSEFSAHNQVMAFQDAVIEQKRNTLKNLGNNEVLSAFTLDSPIPYSIEAVYTTLSNLNEEMEQGSRGLKQGKFFGQFSRLLTRIRSKMSDKRYGFLFLAPEEAHQYNSMLGIVYQLMNFYGENKQVKVIDFSEVPTDILPVIVGLVARLIFQVQFWTDDANRHPIALVCDEAHLYLPKKDGQNPMERRAIETFEKIAKEGRKYGIALLVVSQRPADVSTTVLSQCNNVIAMRLTNAEDQATVKKLMPDSLESLFDVLPIMDTGEALIVGDAVLLPSRIKVEPPEEKPLSSTVDFWSEWSQDGAVASLFEVTSNFDVAIENMRRQRRNRQ